MRNECTPIKVLVGRWLVDKPKRAKMEALVRELGLTMLLDLILTPAKAPGHGLTATITICCKGLDSKLRGTLSFDVVPTPGEDDPALMLAALIMHPTFQRKFILVYVARLQASEYL